MTLYGLCVLVCGSVLCVCVHVFVCVLCALLCDVVWYVFIMWCVLVCAICVHVLMCFVCDVLCDVICLFVLYCVYVLLACVLLC